MFLYVEIESPTLILHILFYTLLVNLYQRKIFEIASTFNDWNFIYELFHYNMVMASQHNVHSFWSFRQLFVLYHPHMR